MNCYVCLVETGNEFRPALAICQRCGAGICGAHLIESVVIPVAGLAGDSSSILICCRCSPSPSPRARRPAPGKQMKGQGEQGLNPWRNWWGWFWRRRSSMLPEPEEAVSAVERFLNSQRNQEM